MNQPAYNFAVQSRPTSLENFDHIDDQVSDTFRRKREAAEAAEGNCEGVMVRPFERTDVPMAKFQAEDRFHRRQLPSWLREPMVFPDLKVGDYFIGFPTEGSNALQRGSHLFCKTSETHGTRVSDGVESTSLQHLQVLLVLMDKVA